MLRANDSTLLTCAHAYLRRRVWADGASQLYATPMPGRCVMIKYRELTTPTSCLNSAAPDEPVFVLRANDELAPSVVRGWALAYKIAKENTGGLSDKQKAKYEEAHALADQMEAWKRAQTG